MTKTGDIFNSQMRRLVIPLLIQNLLSAAVSSADVVMLNYVGQSSVSAVSLATQYANILFAVYYGLGSGIVMICAQYYGKGDMRTIHVVQGIALRFSMTISLVFAAGALFIPETLMKLFTGERELILLGASYLRIMSISYLCWGIIEVYLSVLRSVGRVAICTALNIMAFLLNILLNAVFIFGLFGAPKLGAVGVAIATSVSRVIELLACFLVSRLSKNVKMKFSYMFRNNKVLFRDFIQISLPALGNDVVWGLAFSMYSAIIGHMGSDAVAANSFVMVIRNLGKVFCLGVAGGGGVLLGRIIGENRLDEARIVAKKVVKFSVIGGFLGSVIVLSGMPFVMWYAKASLSVTALNYLKWMLLFNVVYIPGTALNIGLNDGVFRAGGDSRFGFICDTIDMWCYAVPFGCLAAFVFKWPVLLVYFILCTDEFVKWPWVIKHYKDGVWLRNITRDNL